MIELIEKHGILISAGSLCLLLGCILFWPAGAQVAGTACLAFVACLAVLGRAGGSRQAFERGEITSAALKRTIAIDASVILIGFLLISALGRWIGAYTGLVVARETEAHWPGMGTTIGILSALATAFTAGFAGWRLAGWAREQLETR